MFLAAAEANTAFTDGSVVTFGQFGNEFVGLRCDGGGFNLGLGRAEFSVSDIFKHRAVEEQGVLKNDRDVFAQGGLRCGTDVGAVDQNCSGGGIVEAGNQ